MKNFVSRAVVLLAVLLPLPGFAAEKPPLIEAEAAPQGHVAADQNASAGRYVTGGGDYQPVFLAPLPARGDVWTVWVRVRGTSVQLKGVATDGKQRELDWAYDKPSLWTWETLGRHTRAELGDRVLVMRGPGAAEGAGLDAVVLAADAALDPNSAFPGLAGVSARIAVHWNTTTGRTTPLLFGSNDWAAIQNVNMTVGDAPFARAVAQTHIAFLRIHNAGLSDAWSDNVTQTWNTAKIKTVYDAPYLQGKTIMQNIPGWPGWMKQQDKVLDPSEYDRYAQFCADLVRIVNKQQGRKVRLWEPFNEQDQNYWAKGKFDDLCALYNKVAVAMKAVDPSIKVGGMAFTWADPAKVEAFLQKCGPNVDFLTWHRYAGEGKDATDKIMTATPGYEATIQMFRALAKKYAPGRAIPLVWDEYSLAYTYQSPETRQWSNVGAVWFASTLKHMADAGLDMAAQWNLKDRFYGLIGNDEAVRPAATVYAWGNQYLVGALAQTQSDQPWVEAMAVRQTNGSQSLLLINKASAPAKVTLALTGSTRSAAWQSFRLDAAGTTEGMPESDALDKDVTLPPYSLLLLRGR